jgi:hypothetical protein
MQRSATAQGLVSVDPESTTETATNPLTRTSATKHQIGIPSPTLGSGTNLVKPDQTLTLPRMGDRVAEPSVPDIGVGEEMRNMVLRLAARALNPGQGIGW